MNNSCFVCYVFQDYDDWRTTFYESKGKRFDFSFIISR